MSEFKKSFGGIHNPLEALRSSFQRLAKKLSHALETSPKSPSCSSGCSYCCYRKIEVSAIELILINSHIKKHFSSPQRAKILRDAKDNARIIRKLTPQEHRNTNLKCPLLVDDKCSIYAIRPFTCRHYHSQSLEDCVDRYDFPDRLIYSSAIDSVKNTSWEHVLEFYTATFQAGYDVNRYDFNSGLVEAMTNPQALSRYKKGRITFLKAIRIRDV